MSIVAAIRKLVAQGFSYEQALTAAETFEAEFSPAKDSIPAALEKRRAYDRERKALLPKNWLDLRRWVFERDHWTCQYCGESNVPLHCDHVVALSRGGSSEPRNLVAACAPCNLSKREHDVAEWLQ